MLCVFGTEVRGFDELKFAYPCVWRFSSVFKVSNILPGICF